MTTDDHEALDLIATRLNMKVWEPADLDYVADVVQSTGRTIADPTLPHLKPWRCRCGFTTTDAVAANDHVCDYTQAGMREIGRCFEHPEGGRSDEMDA